MTSQEIANRMSEIWFKENEHDLLDNLDEDWAGKISKENFWSWPFQKTGIIQAIRFWDLMKLLPENRVYAGFEIRSNHRTSAETDIKAKITTNGMEIFPFTLHFIKARDPNEVGFRREKTRLAGISVCGIDKARIIAYNPVLRTKVKMELKSCPIKFLEDLTRQRMISLR